MSEQIAVVVGWTLVAAGASVTLGELVRVVLLTPRSGAERFALGRAELRVARVAVLFWVAALLVLALAFVARDTPAGGLVTDPDARAAIAAAVLAVLAAIGLWLVRRWVTLLPVLALSVAAVLPPVLTGWVSVGRNHDLATDALIFAAPAATIAFGVTLAAVRKAPKEGVEATRFLTLAAICAAALFGGGLVLAVVRLSQGGRMPWQLWLFFAVAAVELLVALAGRRARTSHRLAAIGSWASAVLTAACLGLLVAVAALPSPGAEAAEPLPVRVLGYDVSAAPTLMRLALDWHVNLLFAVPAVGAVAAYFVGVGRLRRRGDRWPAGRTVAWVCGWVVVVLATSSGLGAYANAAFSAHMALHMAVNMLGPLLLVLGGGVTLLLRASRARPVSEPAGVHEWVTTLLAWRLARSTYNPLFVFVRFVGAYYILYLTPLFALAVQFRWSYQLMNVEFLAVGYVFYGMAIGVDPLPRSLPHIGKLAVVLAAMPFHAFFGVIIMTSSTLIAGDFYRRLDLPWVGSLASDQYLGGGIAWAAGEFPLILVVIALVTQWSRQDARQAARTDRHLDSGLDDSFEAYNQMLAKLSQAAPGSGPDGEGNPITERRGDR